MKSEEFYTELDQMEKDGVEMLCAAPELRKQHPAIPLLYCNKIVLDWIKERDYYARYQEKTFGSKGTKKAQG